MILETVKMAGILSEEVQRITVWKRDFRRYFFPSYFDLLVILPFMNANNFI